MKTIPDTGKPAPRTKRDFYTRWERLEFGNKIRTFPCHHDLHDYHGLVTVREKTAGGFCRYLVPAQEAYHTYTDSKYTFNEAAPDEQLLLQGEICTSIRHYD